MWTNDTELRAFMLEQRHKWKTIQQVSDQLEAERTRLTELGYFRLVFGFVPETYRNIIKTMRRLRVDYVDITDNHTEIWIKPKDWSEVQRMHAVLKELGVSIDE